VQPRSVTLSASTASGPAASSLLPAAAAPSPTKAHALAISCEPTSPRCYDPPPLLGGLCCPVRGCAVLEHPNLIYPPQDSCFSLPLNSNSAVRCFFSLPDDNALLATIGMDGQSLLLIDTATMK
jgi:hypothetical protein